MNQKVKPLRQPTAKTRLLGLATLGLATTALALPAHATPPPSGGGGFSGPYAPANWSLTNSASTITPGSVNTAGAPGSITLTGSTGTFATTAYTTTASSNGPLSFSWNFTNPEDFADNVFSYVLNGNTTQIAVQSGTGTFTGNLSIGDIFGFRLLSLDTDIQSGSVTITNFSAPVPGPLPLLGLGAAFSYSRRLRRRTGLIRRSMHSSQV